MTNASIEKFVESGKLVTEIANHARDNQSFREKLIAAPHATINEYAGEDEIFPRSTNIVVNEPNEGEVYLIIPRRVDIDDLELSDIELENLSGGSDFVAGLIVGGLAIGAGYLLSKL